MPKTTTKQPKLNKRQQQLLRSLALKAAAKSLDDGSVELPPGTYAVDVQEQIAGTVQVGWPSTASVLDFKMPDMVAALMLQIEVETPEDRRQLLADALGDAVAIIRKGEDSKEYQEYSDLSHMAAKWIKEQSEQYGARVEKHKKGAVKSQIKVVQVPAKIRKAQ